MGRSGGRRRNRRKAPARKQSPHATQRFEPTMKGLSNELNFMIDLCLTDPVESANYRLVSKQFACIGEEVHFKIFRFGNTCNEKKNVHALGRAQSNAFRRTCQGSRIRRAVGALTRRPKRSRRGCKAPHQGFVEGRSPLRDG